jgi:predicted GIY-YIG superfamily endonuclease
MSVSADRSGCSLRMVPRTDWWRRRSAIGAEPLGCPVARPEAARTGVYVLAGADPERSGGLLAYIGEADDVAARLRHHLRSESKDFFERLAVVVSSADSLTKGHARYLESQLIRLVREAGTVALTNDTHPDFQRLPEADRADMDFFVTQVATVLPLLGFDLFRRAPTGRLSRVRRQPTASSPLRPRGRRRGPAKRRQASSCSPARLRGGRKAPPSQQGTLR